jgi:hypothetical protein
VYEVKDRKGGQRFALKQVIVGDDEEKLLLCERELEIMVPLLVPSFAPYTAMHAGCVPSGG